MPEMRGDSILFSEFQMQSSPRLSPAGEEEGQGEAAQEQADREYLLGQWEGFNRVLNLLNEMEDRMILKKHLYEQIMEMRPRPRRPLEEK